MPYSVFVVYFRFVYDAATAQGGAHIVQSNCKVNDFFPIYLYFWLMHCRLFTFFKGALCFDGQISVVSCQISVISCQILVVRLQTSDFRF